MGDSSVRVVLTMTIRPSQESERRSWELTAWDLAVLSIPYIQKGLLFGKPPGPLGETIQRLRDSLSQCLVHFPFLAGRLATQPKSTTFVDCSNSGVQFVVAEANEVSLQDIVSDGDVPNVVKSFFPLGPHVISFDGHSLPPLAVQVTELTDGVFIGCSFNHVMGDGESFWHFFKSWSELSAGSRTISRLPLTNRPPIHFESGPICFQVSEKDIDRFVPPPLRVRFFRFTRAAIALVKARANQQCKPENGEISSLQALIALMWRSITRARSLTADQITTCRMAIGNRSRLDPPISQNYFGNCLEAFTVKAEVGELLAHDLGWAARALHGSIKTHTDAKARAFVKEWAKHPVVYHLSMSEPGCIFVGSSPRYEIYGIDFGWGTARTVLSGAVNKYDGKISAYAGIDGRGSIDLEVCLLPHFMDALEKDEELLHALSPM